MANKPFINSIGNKLSKRAKRQLYPNLIGGGGPGGGLFVPAPLWDADPGDAANRTVGGIPLAFSAVVNRTVAVAKTADFIQNTLADRPEVQTNVFGTVDGMRTLQDSTDFMDSPGNGGAPGPAVPPELTVFMRFKYTAGNTVFDTVLLRMAFTDWITAAGVIWTITVNSFNRITSTMFNVMAGSPFNTVSSNSGSMPNGSTNLLVIRYSRINNLTDMRLNGVTQNITNTVASVALTTPRISVFNWGNISGSAFAGDVSYGDFRGYGAFLNQAQIDEVSAEINANV